MEADIMLESTWALGIFIHRNQEYCDTGTGLVSFTLKTHLQWYTRSTKPRLLQQSQT